ncbi:MAG: hypothetical protein EPN93_11445 [Spirochaetes bacterium]|nr:MAG: hypothetical protein EPN93_11445 [Spirochaetota bacterium]
MKKYFRGLYAIPVACILFGCGGSSGDRPRDVLDAMQKIFSSDDFSGAKKFYTKGTRSAFDDLDKLNPRSRKEEAIPDGRFAKGARWELLDESIQGDSAKVRIKYTKHPVENNKGLEVSFNMKKEDDGWKIDMEKEIRETISLIKKMKK